MVFNEYIMAWAVIETHFQHRGDVFQETRMLLWSLRCSLSVASGSLGCSGRNRSPLALSVATDISCITQVNVFLGSSSIYFLQRSWCSSIQMLVFSLHSPVCITGPFSKFATSNLSLITMEMKSSHKQSQRQALKSVQQSSSASPFMSFHVLDEPLRWQKRCVTSLGCARATLQGWGLSLGEEQHPEFQGIMEWLSCGCGCPTVPEGPFTCHGGRRHLCDNSLGPCKSADICVPFWSMSQVCARDVEPLQGWCLPWSSWWALLWLRVLLSGWRGNNRQGIFLFLLLFCWWFFFFLDVKQMKWNNFFCNILPY